MWKFSGEIGFDCKSCNQNGCVNIDDFEHEHIYSHERQMGTENTYKLSHDNICMNCNSYLYFEFHVYEYPDGIVNYIEQEHKNIISHDEPYIEYFDTYYEVENFGIAEKTIRDVILGIQKEPQLIRNITHRQFEELIAELFKAKGFEVELTKITRDGGKDIIAISTDQFGTKLKYFIECKHYSEDNKVTVDLVRSLYGVKHSKEGPNKVILVTSSSFTTDAINFVNKEINSSWDMSLFDYDQIIGWVKNYNLEKFNNDF